MTTKSLLAALAGAVAAFLLGWLLFGLLMNGFYMSHSSHFAGLMKEPPNMIGIIGYNVGWSLLFALIYSKWANISSFSQGFMAGLWIGFLLAFGLDMMFYAFFHLYDHTALVADVLVNTVFWGIVGGVIGMVLGMGKKAA